MKRRPDAPGQFVFGGNGVIKLAERILDRARNSGFWIGQRSIEVKVDCVHPGPGPLSCPLIQGFLVAGDGTDQEYPMRFCSKAVRSLI